MIDDTGRGKRVLGTEYPIFPENVVRNLKSKVIYLCIT